MISREQLDLLGYTESAVRHRLARGRLYEIFFGVFAVGRHGVTHQGRWMAAVLACGKGAVLSHETAAHAWGILRPREGPIHVSIPYMRCTSCRGVHIHRRTNLPACGLTLRHNIPITSAPLTLVDLACRLPSHRLEAAVSEADKLDLLDLVHLRKRLEELPRLPGKGVLRALLDRDTLHLTDSELERRFLRLVRAADLPEPLTQQALNGHRVDFHWPDLGLVVETDGLRYHRTPAQQAGDHRRDQVHARAGLTTMRFTHAQVFHEPEYVRETLRRVISRLSSSA